MDLHKKNFKTFSQSNLKNGFIFYRHYVQNVPNWKQFTDLLKIMVWVLQKSGFIPLVYI